MTRQEVVDEIADLFEECVDEEPTDSQVLISFDDGKKYRITVEEIV